MPLAVLVEAQEKILKVGIGNAETSGICHSWGADGRCISLLKILFSNSCIYDCKYCINRCTNSVKRATFTPRELADLTINFYKRNYIEGLFLSSAVVRSPDYTMELLVKTVSILRNEYKFNGYIHCKTIPSCSPELIDKLGNLVDRLSINIELPSNDSLKLLAPQKQKDGILEPMQYISKNIQTNHGQNKMSSWKLVNKTLLYDGSFFGLLTIVFDCFSNKTLPAKICSRDCYVNNLKV